MADLAPVPGQRSPFDGWRGWVVGVVVIGILVAVAKPWGSDVETAIASPSAPTASTRVAQEPAPVSSAAGRIFDPFLLGPTAPSAAWAILTPRGLTALDFLAADPVATPSAGQAAESIGTQPGRGGRPRRRARHDRRPGRARHRPPAGGLAGHGPAVAVHARRIPGPGRPRPARRCLDGTTRRRPRPSPERHGTGRHPRLGSGPVSPRPAHRTRSTPSARSCSSCGPAAMPRAPGSLARPQTAASRAADRAHSSVARCACCRGPPTCGPSGATSAGGTVTRPCRAARWPRSGRRRPA